MDGPPAGDSANPASHMPSAQSAGIPLLDLLHREIARAGKARRASPAVCTFSREVRCQEPLAHMTAPEGAECKLQR